MKKPKLILGLFAAACCLFSLMGCSDNCRTTYTYIDYQPVSVNKADIRSGVAVEPGKLIEGRGKIFFKGGYLFVNEPKNGIHVIDNRDPRNPTNIAFIKVPGSFDITVKNDLLFTDSFMDLVTFDISDLNNIHEVNRLEDYFQAHGQFGFQSNDASSQVVVDWIELSREEVSDFCDAVPFQGGRFWMENGFLRTAMDASALASGGTTTGPAPGIAGSLSRFAQSGDQLYVLDNGAIKNLDLTAPLNPQPGENLQIGWDIETLFPRNNELFVGARSGMHIVDISNRSQPEYLSTFSHATNCDPVIVDGNIAYVTLRSGNVCEGFENQLDVVDITDLRSPRLLHTYPMHNPHGLSKDGDALFICDGDAGLKVFDASEIAAIDQHLLAHDKSIQAYDVIAYNNIAMLIGDDGLHQYDYSNLNNIRHLSTITITHE